MVKELKFKIIKAITIKLALYYLGMMFEEIAKGAGMKVTFKINGLEVRVGEEENPVNKITLNEFLIEKEMESEEYVMLQEARKEGASTAKAAGGIIELVKEVSEKGLDLWQQTIANQNRELDLKEKELKKDTEQ